ncbi:MgtC/SapB family protein [Euzebya sp.]|uniref:MgtC/SapB family protein n=1 Tax=Euzebya sp. TaxID=1971409 RepID=UPI003511C323
MDVLTTVDWTPVWRILLAAGLALPIGLEREVRGKAAGLRTLLLLAAAAGTLGWLSVTAGEAHPNSDATRIASYTIAGIGFLGAGLIFGIRGRLYGLTTAVAAFTVTAIGLTAGMGYPLAATALTVVALLALRPADWVKARTYARWTRAEATLHVVVSPDGGLDRIHLAVAGSRAELRALEFTPLEDGRLVVQMTVRGKDDDIEDLSHRIRAEDGVLGLATVAGAAQTIGD